MPGWTACGDWMHFRHLDGGDDLDGAYTIGYRITDDDGADPWTARFNRFKAKDPAAFIGGAKAVCTRVPALLESLGVDVKDAVFVPALGSGETQAADDGQLALLAKQAAKVTSAQFELSALSKQIHKPIHGIFNAGEREAELDKAAYIATKLPATNVFVFDDLITRGSTLNRMARAIKAVNSDAKVYGVALAKTERRSFWGTLTNDHVAKEWEELWQQGERLYNERRAKGAG
jgi:hypothetical protein